MSAATDALRKALTFACNDPGHFVGFKGERSLGEWQADAIMQGPLADLIAPEAGQAYPSTFDEALAYIRPPNGADSAAPVTLNAGMLRCCVSAILMRVSDLVASAATADRDASEYADAMDARMADALLIENLRIAFLVLAESGHGGGMAEVRRWFAAGATGPIPWPGGKLFEVWAAEHDIYDCNAAMGFRRRDSGRAV